MKISAMSLIGGASLALLIQIAPAGAQATRTWVSGVGDDANLQPHRPMQDLRGGHLEDRGRRRDQHADPGGFGAVDDHQVDHHRR